MYEMYIIYIDKFHRKLVYVGLAQARPNYNIVGAYVKSLTPSPVRF